MRKIYGKNKEPQLQWMKEKAHNKWKELKNEYLQQRVEGFR